MLIPVLIPERVRYRLLHNQVDLVLANELHHRPDVVVARVPMSITPPDRPAHRDSDHPDDDHRNQSKDDEGRSENHEPVEGAPPAVEPAPGDSIVEVPATAEPTVAEDGPPT